MASGYWHICDENTVYEPSAKKYVLSSPANFYYDPNSGSTVAKTNKQILFDFKNIKADLSGIENDCGGFTGTVPFCVDDGTIVGSFENDSYKFTFEIYFQYLSDDVTPANEILFYATGK